MGPFSFLFALGSEGTSSLSSLIGFTNTVYVTTVARRGDDNVSV